MSDTDSSINRRGFLGTAGVGAATLAAAGLAMPGTASARSREINPAFVPTNHPGPAATFGPLRQIDAGLLNVGYAEVGPADGPPVICLHGWPYDIHSYVEVAPLLARRGYRVIVPYFRGYGTTTFLSSSTVRDGEQAALALDLIAFMDALNIDQAILAGFDWGSVTNDSVAALWPERCKALVSVGGYSITNPAAELAPAPPNFEWAFWYAYYFSTARGVLGLGQNAAALRELVWKFNSPTWNFSQATYDATATAFTNPDYVSVWLAITAGP